MCVLGRRLLKDIEIDNCTKEIDGILWKEFCVLQNNTRDRDFLRNPDVYRLKEDNWNCDSYFQGMCVLEMGFGLNMILGWKEYEDIGKAEVYRSKMTLESAILRLLELLGHYLVGN